MADEIERTIEAIARVLNRRKPRAALPRDDGYAVV
jgi:hypothetical protein